MLLVDRAAAPRVLVAEGPVDQPRLHEPGEVALHDLAEGISVDVALLGVPVIEPVPATLVILGGICGMSQSSGHPGDAEVIVGVLDAAADGATGRARTILVHIIPWNPAEAVPGDEIATTFYTPVFGFHCPWFSKEKDVC